MCEESTADEAAVPGGLLGGRETASAANGCARRADAGRPRGAMADGYRLWAPSPLDESLGWLRGTRPQPPPAASAHPFRWAGLQAAASGQRGGGAALPRPQAVRLQSLDAVFERLVTAQPPRRIGVLRVSERSAFCRVVDPRRWRARGLREAEARVVAAMCQQMMRAILLLYAAYKKCAFVLQHAHCTPAERSSAGLPSSRARSSHTWKPRWGSACSARSLTCVARLQSSTGRRLVEAGGCGGGRQLHPVDESLCAPCADVTATPACVCDLRLTGAAGKHDSGLPCCAKRWVRVEWLEGPHPKERCCCCWTALREKVFTLNV